MALNEAGFSAKLLANVFPRATDILNAPLDDNGLALYYYDATRVFYLAHDYLSPLLSDAQKGTLISAALKGIQLYRDYYLRNPAVNYVASGFWNFSSGMRMHWERTGDELSRTSVIALSTSAAFSRDSTVLADVWDANSMNPPNNGGSREVAYAITAHLDAEACGAARRPILTTVLIPALLHHFDQWATGLAYTYVRPFMIGLSCEALIRLVSAGLVTEAEAKAKMNPVFDYIDATCWDAGTNSFLYTDRIGVPPGDAWASTDDGLPAPDLNMLIAPAYQWCSRIPRAEALWQGAIDGAYVANGKQFNQSYRWAFQQLAWAAQQVDDPDITPEGPSEGEDTKFVTYRSCTKFSCCDGSDIILGLDSSLVISGAPFIAAKLVSTTLSAGTCGTCDRYNYYISYNANLLNSPSTPIYSSQITGMLCKGLLIDYINWITEQDADVPPTDPVTPPEDPVVEPPVVAPFNASDYGTPVWHLDFTNNSNLQDSGGAAPTNGEKIATVLDATANNYDITQTNDTYRPTLLTGAVNGYQVGVFTGAEGFEIPLASASAITKARAGLTIALVAKLTDFTSVQLLLRMGLGANVRTDVSFMAANARSHVQLRPQDAGVLYDGYSPPGSDPAEDAWHCWVYKLGFASNTFEMWLDGVQLLDVTDINSTGNSDNTDCTGADSNIIFFNDYGSAGIVGEIGELVVWDGAISDTNVLNAIASLETKYGLSF